MIKSIPYDAYDMRHMIYHGGVFWMGPIGRVIDAKSGQDFMKFQEILEFGLFLSLHMIL